MKKKRKLLNLFSFISSSFSQCSLCSDISSREAMREKFIQPAIINEREMNEMRVREKSDGGKRAIISYR
jgi:hypothetical protein